MRVFFGGPLTDLADPEATKKFYVRLADVATKNGWEYYWAWQRGTDPELDPDVPASRVYQIDTYELEISDVMIAYVGEPSTGTGIEMEYARHNRIPVVIMYEKEKRISRMLRGCPAVVKEIVYGSEDEAISLLDDYLKTYKK
jgi:nucleoside 2-deoxyribosyltransferase